MHLMTDEIQLVMRQFQPAGDSPVSGLTQLKAAFEGKLVEGATMYSEETCVKFHQLLIAVLVGYWKALVELDEATKGEKGLGTSIVGNSKNTFHLAELAFNVWHFSHLLWQIAHS